MYIYTQTSAAQAIIKILKNVANIFILHHTSNDASSFEIKSVEYFKEI